MSFSFWPAVPCHRHKLSTKGIFFPPWIELQISATWIVNRFLSPSLSSSILFISIKSEKKSFSYFNTLFDWDYRERLLLSRIPTMWEIEERSTCAIILRSSWNRHRLSSILQSSRDNHNDAYPHPNTIRRKMTNVFEWNIGFVLDVGVGKPTSWLK